MFQVIRPCILPVISSDCRALCRHSNRCFRSRLLGTQMEYGTSRESSLSPAIYCIYIQISGLVLQAIIGFIMSGLYIQLVDHSSLLYGLINTPCKTNQTHCCLRGKFQESILVSVLTHVQRWYTASSWASGSLVQETISACWQLRVARQRFEDNSTVWRLPLEKSVPSLVRGVSVAQLLKENYLLIKYWNTSFSPYDRW